MFYRIKYLAKKKKKKKKKKVSPKDWENLNNKIDAFKRKVKTFKCTKLNKKYYHILCIIGAYRHFSKMFCFWSAKIL